METAHLSAYLGDSAVLEIPLTWDGEDFDPGNDWALIFTAKIKASDADSDAVIQKTTGSGITSSAGLASVALVPQDTVDLIVRNLVCDVQAQHTTTGAVRTVGYARLSLLRDITRETETSIPVITTEEPSPLYGAVRFDASQSLTSPQKAQARTNIGAITGSEITNSNVNSAISTDASATRTALGLGSAATLSTSAGGNGLDDAGKVLVFGSGGGVTGASLQVADAGRTSSFGATGFAFSDQNSEFLVYGQSATLTDYRTFTFPDATGTIALAEQTQATLVSGTNIKTVNGSSLLGSGNLSITSDLSSGPVTSSAGVSAIADGAIGVAKITGLGSLATISNLTGVVTSTGAATSIADSALSIAKTSGLQTALDSKQSTITFGTGVQTALGVNIGSAGAPVLFNGALGTPSSGTLTNATGLPISTGVSGLGTSVASSLAQAINTSSGFVTQSGGDSRYPIAQKKVSTAQADSTVAGNLSNETDITGLTGFSLEANTVYRLEFYGLVTCPAAGGYMLRMKSSANLENTAAAYVPGIFSGAIGTGGGLLNPYQHAADTITIAQRTEARSSSPTFAMAFFKTGASAPTVKIQVAQNATSGTTSVLIGAVCTITKLTP